MIVRIRVTEERDYFVDAETPEAAEALVRGEYLAGACGPHARITKIRMPDIRVRAIDPRIPRAVRRAAKAGK